MVNKNHIMSTSTGKNIKRATKTGFGGGGDVVQTKARTWMREAMRRDETHGVWE